MAIIKWSDSNISQLSKPSIVIGRSIYPTNDALYGPYTSLSDAYDSVSLYLGSKSPSVSTDATDLVKILAGAKLIPQGLTVGVIETDGILEYWFKKSKVKSTDAYTKSDLVKKASVNNGGGGDSGIRFENYSDADYNEYN